MMNGNVYNRGTIAAMLYNRAKSLPKYVAYRFPQHNQYYSWEQVNAAVKPIAQNLINLGVKKGDKVALLMEGRIEFIHSFYAAATIGAITVPLNTYSKKAELELCLKDACPSVLIMSSTGQHLNYLQLLKEIISDNAAADTSWLPAHVFVLDETKELSQPFKTFSELCDNKQNVNDDTYFKMCSQVFTHDPVLLLYTSGTTGTPKSVLRTTDSYLVSKSKKYVQPGRLKKRVTTFFDRISNRFRVALLMPLYHQGGVSLLFVTLSASNVQLVMLSRFNPVTALKVIKDEQCDFIIATPYMIQNVMNVSPETDDLNTVKGIVFSAAAVNHNLLERTRAKFKKLALFIVSYGTSETGSVANGTCVFPENADFYISVLLKFLKATNLLSGLIKYEAFVRTPFSIGGKVDKNVNVKIQDTVTGAFLPLGKEGEIIASSHKVMRYTDETAIKEAFLPDGSFKTGDLGYLTDDNLIVISGRLKRQISRGGEKISPVEVEIAILKDTAIADAFVVGIPDSLYGEQVCAAVVAKEGQHINVDRLRQDLQLNLSSFKVPQHIVILPDLPLSSTGKIAVKYVRELILEKMKKENPYA